MLGNEARYQWLLQAKTERGILETHPQTITSFIIATHAQRAHTGAHRTVDLDFTGGRPASSHWSCHATRDFRRELCRRRSC